MKILLYSDKLKNGQKRAKFKKNHQKSFFVDSALQKLPNVLKLAMKWPTWQLCSLMHEVERLN